MSDDNQRHPTHDELWAILNRLDLENLQLASKSWKAYAAKPDPTDYEKSLMPTYATVIAVDSDKLIVIADAVPGLLDEIVQLRLSCADGMERMKNDHQREIDELRYQRMQDLADCNNNKDIALRDLQVQHLEEIAQLNRRIDAYEQAVDLLYEGYGAEFTTVEEGEEISRWLTVARTKEASDA